MNPCFFTSFIALIFATTVILARRGASLPNFSLRPPLIERGRVHYKSTYACEGNPLHLSCEDGRHVHLVRANYGRFSISICNDHGNLDWSVNCMSYRSFLIMQDKCSQKSSCNVVASSHLFGDPCPGTLKYLEIQYYCVHGSPSGSGTRRPPHLNIPMKGMVPNVTSLPPATTLLATTGLPEDQASDVPMVGPRPSQASASATTAVAAVMSPVPSQTSQPFDVSGNTTSRTPSFFGTTRGPFYYRTPEPPFHEEIMTIDLSKEFCAPTYARNLFWNWTRSGENSIQKCPGGATGLVRWFCGVDPIQWTPEKPDFRGCRSPWVDSLEERLRGGDSVVSVASELALMTRTKSLYCEDLKHISDVIQDALARTVTKMETYLEMWHRHQVLMELLQSVVATVSNLLDGTQDDAWQDLTVVERRHVASSLLDGLEETALLLADVSSTESSHAVAKANVLVSVQVIEAKPSEGVRFPSPEDLQGTSWIRMEDALILPSQGLLEHSRNGLSKAVFLAFNRVEDLLRPDHRVSQAAIFYSPDESLSTEKNTTHIINSKVIGASFGRKTRITLSEPVTIILRHLQVENVTNPKCVFWDRKMREWSENGCRVQATNLTHTICSCDHLTNFAVLMDVKPTKVSYHDGHILYLVTCVGCALAGVCLLITGVGLQFLSGNTKCDRIIIHKNLCLCLMVTELVFVGGMGQIHLRILCGVVAGLLHYFLLAAFAWMFLEGFQLYVMLIDVYENQKSRAGWYYALAYGAPALIVAISAIVDPHSYGTEFYCWLRVDNYFCFSFVGPAVGILFGGTVFLFIASCIVCHHPSISTTTIKSKQDAKMAAARTGICCAIILLCILALTWTAGFFFVNQESEFLAYAFTILNSLQGIVIFFYCLMNEEVQDELRRLVQNVKWMPPCLRSSKTVDLPTTGPYVPSTSLVATAPAQGPELNNSQVQVPWNLPMEKNSNSVLKLTTPDPPSTSVPSPAPEVANPSSLIISTNSGSVLVDSFTDSRFAHLITPVSESRTLPVGSTQSGNSSASAKWQQQSRRDDYRPSAYNFSAGGFDSYGGTFPDHIYESIDDESGASSSEYHHSSSSHPTTTGESCYGDQSDWSQHSSSSYGYDQRPLLVAMPANALPAPLVQVHSGSASRDSTAPCSPELQRHTYDRNIGSLSRSQCDNQVPFDVFAGNRTHNSSLSQRVFEGLSAHQSMPRTDTSAVPPGDDDGGSWSPTLPDLLQCPGDSASVMAVLDGEKVVSRLRPENEQRHIVHQKFSTYF